MHSSMWLGLQTVSSLERCSIFSVLYREVPLYIYMSSSRLVKRREVLSSVMKMMTLPWIPHQGVELPRERDSMTVLCVTWKTWGLLVGVGGARACTVTSLSPSGTRSLGERVLGTSPGGRSSELLLPGGPVRFGTCSGV